MGGKSRGMAGKILKGMILPFLILLFWWFAAPHTFSIESVSQERVVEGEKVVLTTTRIVSHPIGEDTIVPTIASVVDVLVHPLEEPQYLDSGSLAWCFFMSLLRVLVGYGFAVMTAVPLGLFAGRSEVMSDLLGPTVEFLRPISPIAWMPVLILAFGFGSVGSWIFGDDVWRHDILGGLTIGIVLIVWSSAFFPLFIDTMHGAGSVKDIYVELARVNGADNRQIFFKVIMPASLPGVITGMRIAMGLAWRAIVAAEIFPGTTGGLGYMITTSHEVVEYRWAFAVIVVIAVVEFAINSGFKTAENRLGGWQARER